MTEYQDNLPRNLIFISTLILSLIIAYFMNLSLLSFLQLFLDINIERTFLGVMDRSSLWGIASYWSTFSLLMFLFVFIIPAFLNGAKLLSLKSKLQELSKRNDENGPITKDGFLKVMEEFTFIYTDFVRPYSQYIIEEPIKNIKLKTNVIGKGKTAKKTFANVSVLITADQVFKFERLLNARLSSWFMAPLPRILMGIGFLILILSVAGMLQSNGAGLTEKKAMDVLFVGVSSFSLCIGTGIFIAGIQRIVTGHIHHRAREIVKIVDSLFLYKPNSKEKSGDFASIENALNKSVSAFKDVTKMLNLKQEETISGIIVSTFDDYVKQLNETASAQSASLLNASEQQNKSYDDIGKNIEKIVSSLNLEVKKTTKALLERKDSVNDLKAVADAANDVTKRFEDITLGLENLHSKIEKVAPMTGERRKKITDELNELKKTSKAIKNSRTRAAKK